MKTATNVLLALVLGLAVIGCSDRKNDVAQEPPLRGVTVVKVKAPPPPPRAVVVTRPARPDARHVWVGGHYSYRGGRYAWVKGAWKLPPRRGVVWVPGRFDSRKGVWISGTWR